MRSRAVGTGWARPATVGAQDRRAWGQVDVRRFHGPRLGCGDDGRCCRECRRILHGATGLGVRCSRGSPAGFAGAAGASLVGISTFAGLGTFAVVSALAIGPCSASVVATTWPRSLRGGRRAGQCLLPAVRSRLRWCLPSGRSADGRTPSARRCAAPASRSHTLDTRVAHGDGGHGRGGFGEIPAGLR